MSMELIEKKRAEYEASHEHRSMVDKDVAAKCLRALIKFGGVSTRGACAAASAYIDESGAGTPEVDYFIHGKPREEARFWSALASPAELDAFFSASANELGHSTMTTKQIKRLIATLFHRLSQQDKANFAAWAGSQT